MLSVGSVECLLEKGLNRLAVLFFWHCTRHIRSTDMESFWIVKKNRQALITLTSAHLAKMHPDPVCAVNSSQHGSDKWRL